MCVEYIAGISVIAERSIATLKNETYKYTNLVSRNVYIEKLDNIVNEYNNIYHSTITNKSPAAAK